MTPISPAPTTEGISPDDKGNRFHVHVYAVIRVKVAIVAVDQPAAMAAADAIALDRGLAVRLTPTCPQMIEAEYADEVTGYLVDEIGDEDFLRSRSYGPDHAPDVSTSGGRMS